MAELAQRDVSNIGTVAGNILKDTEKLVRTEFDLFEAKLKRDVNETIASGIYVAVGFFFFIAAVICALIMLVNLGIALQLPLWASYGLTAAICGLACGFTYRLARGKNGRQRKEN